MPRSSPFSTTGLLLALVVATSCSEQSTGPLSRAVGGGATRQASGLLAPSSPGWQGQARTLIAANNLSPNAAARVLAALSVAQYRAVMAVDDPDLDGQLPEHGVGPGGRSALDAHRGAVAGASAQVLSFFFPAASASFEQQVLAEGDAGPGNVHPEFTRGLAIGRTAGDAIVERTKNDRFTAPWTGTVPTGPGKWIANGPPAGPTLGGALPYLLASGDQFRPPPPPAFGSAAFLADLDEIRTLALTRTPEQLAIALYWNLPVGTSTAAGYWNAAAADYIEANGLDERGATHAFALVHAAMMDAMIGCWDAKYYYWQLRPSHADPSISLTFALPNHPSYPSGHSCVSAAAGEVLQHLFPDRAAEVNAWVIEAGLSRMYAGIHYRSDILAGRDLGRAVAQRAISLDQSSGLLAAIRY